jgi:DNA processing protein
MALGVIVVEAAERSGSLITARLALEAGREVFAVPGSPIDPRAGGTNKLLKDGATLVTSAADIIEVLTPILGQHAPTAVLREPSAPDAVADEPTDVGAQRERIVGLLSPAPISLDDLARMAAAPPNAVQIVLLELELAGRLERHGGGLVSLT